MKLRLMLSSPEPVLHAGLKMLLGELGELEFISSSAPPLALPQGVSRVRPDILLIDVTPEITLGKLGEIRRRAPDCSIILWVKNLPNEFAYQAMSAGIRGILHKDVPVRKLVECIQSVRNGGVWFDDELVSGFFRKPVVRLTRRESDLVTLVAQGLKNKEIAYELKLSEGTVKVYLSRLFEKLNVKDRLELALYGLKHLTTGPGEQRLESKPDDRPRPAFTETLARHKTA